MDSFLPGGGGFEKIWKNVWPIPAWERGATKHLVSRGRQTDTILHRTGQHHCIEIRPKMSTMLRLRNSALEGWRGVCPVNIQGGQGLNIKIAREEVVFCAQQYQNSSFHFPQVKVCYTIALW